MKTIVKPREFTASELTAFALAELDRRNIEAWRSNNVRAVRGRTFTGRKGVGDILGFHRQTGVLVSAEVKKIGDKLSKDQIEFLTQVKQAGAIALVVRQSGPLMVIEGFEP